MVISNFCRPHQIAFGSQCPKCFPVIEVKPEAILIPMRTVGELRDWLNTLDPDLPVILEGCDCFNLMDNGKAKDGNAYLYIDREDKSWK